MRVTILEKQNDILQGTSRATHNRAHLGYHYPRSPQTARECLEGYRYFVAHFPDALYFPGKSYYLIEKDLSKVTTDEYKSFCESMGLHFQMEWPDECFVKREHLDASFMVIEPCFDLHKLKSHFLQQISQLRITLICNYELAKAELLSSRQVALTNQHGESTRFKADAVINATYTATNNVQRLFGTTEELSEYTFHQTEVVVAEASSRIPSLTVMDGPFVTILPCAHESDSGRYLVYDVSHSVVDEKEGHVFEGFGRRSSNWPKMVDHGSRYYAMMRDLRYVKSLWADRPIPTSVTDASRRTRILRHNCMDAFFSVMEGKFISAPLVAVQLAEQIVEEI